MVPLQLGGVQHPVADGTQSFARIAYGPLQPAIVSPSSRREGQDLRLVRTFDHRRQLGLAATGHLVADAPLVPLVTGFVKSPPLEALGQVLLGDPVLTIGVGIQIALAVPEPFRVAAAVF